MFILVCFFWSNFYEWWISFFCFVVCRNLVMIGDLFWDFLWEIVEVVYFIVELRFVEFNESIGVEYMYYIYKFLFCEIYCVLCSV